MPYVIDIVRGSVEGDIKAENTGSLPTLHRGFKVDYYVISDTTSDGISEIRLATGLPTLYGPLDGCWAKDFKFKEVDVLRRHPRTGVPCSLWEVSVDFDNKIDPTAPGGINASQFVVPPSLPPTISWGGELDETQLAHDAIFGPKYPVVNACGEALYIPTNELVSDLTITRYENAPFNPQIQLKYANTVNLLPFWGAPPRSAYMMPIRAEYEDIDGIRYAKVTYHIRFKITKAYYGWLTTRSGDFGGVIEFFHNNVYQPLHTYIVGQVVNISDTDRLYGMEITAVTATSITVAGGGMLSALNRLMPSVVMPPEGSTLFVGACPWEYEALNEGYLINTGNLVPDLNGLTQPVFKNAVDSEGKRKKVNLKWDGTELGDTDLPQYLQFNRCRLSNFNELQFPAP